MDSRWVELEIVWNCFLLNYQIMVVVTDDVGSVRLEESGSIQSGNPARQ